MVVTFGETGSSGERWRTPRGKSVGQKSSNSIHLQHYDKNLLYFIFCYNGNLIQVEKYICLLQKWIG